MAPNRPGNAHDGTDLGARIRPADLAQRKPHRFVLVLDATASTSIATELDLIDLRKARLEGVLTPVGGQDWDLQAQLGATVVQPCVASLQPVTTRIDDDVIRRYRSHLPEDTLEGEIEMPEDDTLEPLPEVIDLTGLFTEALALALPLYPRADAATVDQAVFTEPGKAPMTDEDARPFAGLAGLKRALGGDTSGNDDTD